jgi:hypothetical protein
MNDTIRGTTRSRLRTVLLFLIAPLLLGVGVFTQTVALDQVREIRMLERIPFSTVHASLPGPTMLRGSVEQAPETELVLGHWTDTPCVWFRALEEVEETDSEGNSSWRTVLDTSSDVPFMVEDETGSARVTLNDRVTIDLTRKMRRTEGRRRYTEYRLDLQDTINLVGMLLADVEPPEITFPEDGEYVPIITDEPISSARSSRGIFSTLMIIISVFSIGAACASLMLGLKLFNTLGFAVVVGTIEIATLLTGGLLMMSDDLAAAHASLEDQLERTGKIASDGLKRLEIEWDGDWRRPLVFEQAARSPEPGPRIAEMRSTLAARALRTGNVRERFPQNIIGSLMGLPPTPVILADGETSPGMDDTIEPAPPFWLWPLLISCIALILAVIGLGAGKSSVKLKRLIENIPTTPANDVDIGICELVGTVNSCTDIEPLEGPLTGQPCIWYRYLEQEWRGTGKNRHLHTILDRRKRQVFTSTDDSGSIPVDLEDARVISGRSASRSSGRRVYTEWSLRPGDPIYILGSAELDPVTGDSLRIAKDPEGLPYIVSNLPEERLKERQISVAFWFLAIGIAASAAVVLGLLLFTGRIAAVDQLLAAAGAIVAVKLLVVGIMYNDLVFLRQRARWARSNIDVAIRKRRDLLPRLEAITKGYMKHEAELQPILSGLRSAWASTTPEVEGGTDDGVSRLLALREQYPELKANSVTEKLMCGIVKLENEIAGRRSGYNAAAERYRARVQAIPEVILARLLRFENMPLLEWGGSIRQLQPLDFTPDERPREDHGQEEIVTEEVGETSSPEEGDTGGEEH